MYLWIRTFHHPIIFPYNRKAMESGHHHAGIHMEMMSSGNLTNQTLSWICRKQSVENVVIVQFFLSFAVKMQRFELHSYSIFPILK